MRLRIIAQASFRRTEQSNFDDLMKKEKLDLGPNDVVLLISETGNQLVFVSRVEEIRAGEKVWRVLPSQRLRLQNGTWNPLMIVNYAERVGIHLDGLRKLEDYYSHLKVVAAKERKEKEKKSKRHLKAVA